MRPLVLAALAFVLLFLCLLAAALCVGGGRGRGRAGAAGGAARRGAPDPAKSPHLVVDTLNLAHYLHPGEQMSPELIVSTIDRTAPTLKMRHPGRVMYVLKDRESQFNDDEARALYGGAARRNGVTVLLAERYPDPPAGVPLSAEHSARGRDDFLTAVLARQWHCAVLTEDRMKDFDRFRATIQPFYALEYHYWKESPNREFYRPESPAYARLKRPKMIRFSEYFGA
jgi:hypothetical protein